MEMEANPEIQDKQNNNNNNLPIRFSPHSSDKLNSNSNSKIENALSSCRKRISPTTIKSILHCFDPNLACIYYHLQQSTNAGDNYMSEVTTIIMYVKDKSCKETYKSTTPYIPSQINHDENENILPLHSLRQIRIFFKQTPSDESTRKMLNGCLAFTKEAEMYKNVLPSLGAYFQDLIPICYSTMNDGGYHDYLALEDLRLSGYRMPDRRQGLDVSHASLALQALAKFHALSYVKYKGDHQLILSEYPFLIHHERVYVPPSKITEFQLAYISQSGAAYSTALQQAGHPCEAETIQKFFRNPQHMIARFYKLISCPTLCPIIGHGDFWINNLLYKYNAEAENEPIGIKFVDFQMIRLGSRTIDLHLFFQTSLGFELTSSLEENLLNIYYTEFQQSSKQLGYFEENILTLQQLQDEFEEFRWMGICMGLFYLPFVHLKSSDLKEMIEYVGNNIYEIYYEFFSSLMNPTTTKKLLRIVRNQILKLK